MTSAGAGGRLAGACAALSSLLACAVLVVELRDTPAQWDDAYISYRYARNLIRGVGLVYNPGEYVEGFTNLLWTLTIALGLRAGFEAPQIGHWLGLAAGMATLVGTLVLARALGARRPLFASVLAPWVVLSAPGFPVWTTSGMETPLFAAAATAALAADAAGRLRSAAVFASLALLTRPEGILLAAALFAPRLLRGQLRSRRLWSAVAIVGVVVLLLTAFRLAYYGSPLPNTFYAKVGGVTWVRGLRYVAGFFGEGAFLLLPGMYWAVRGEPRAWAAFGAVGALVAFSVAVGGDVFPHARFLVPVLPAMAALAARGVAEAARRGGAAALVTTATYLAAPVWIAVSALAGGLGLAAAAAYLAVRARGGKPAPAAAAAAAVLALLAAIAAAVWPSAARAPAEVFAGGRRALALKSAWDGAKFLYTITERTGRALAEARPPVRLLAAGGIGVIGYTSELRIVDYLGLITPEVARTRQRAELAERAVPGHQRSNADFVLAQRPDVILLPRELAGQGEDEVITAVRDLLQHPDLRRDYEFREHPWPAWWRRTP